MPLGFTDADLRDFLDVVLGPILVLGLILLAPKVFK
jgi:hypothetical protein